MTSQANSDILRRLYHEADVFCLPTEGDCLPLVLAEAAASGLPTISTTIAAIPEIVRHGETGLLIQPRDLGGLVAALQRMDGDGELRLRMGERAAALAAAEHDAGRNALKLLDVVKQVADESGTPARAPGSPRLPAVHAVGVQLADHPRRYAAHEGVRRHIAVDQRSGRHHCAGPDRDARQDGAASTDPRALPDGDWPADRLPPSDACHGRCREKWSARALHDRTPHGRLS